MGAIVSLISALGPVALQAILPSLLPDDSAVLKILQEIAPRIPEWIASGEATVDLYQKVEQVIAERRAPNSAEWDALEALIKDQQASFRDTSRDVPTP